jgi:outer membrane protein assembly factor BamB
MPYKNLAIKIGCISMCFSVILLMGFPGLLPAQTAAASPSLKKCWEYATTELNDRGVAADTTTLYLSKHGGRLEAVSIDGGSRLWFSDLGGEIVSNIAESESAVFVVTRSPGSAPKSVLRSLSKTTGITNWVADVPDGDAVFLGSLKNSLIAVSGSGMVSAVNVSNGSARWTANLKGKIAIEPSFSASEMMVATESKELVVVSLETGNVSFRKAVSYRPTAVLLTENSTGAWGDERGNLFLLDTVTQKPIWKLKQGAEVSGIDILGETLLATSNDNFAYSIALSDGNVRWKKRQPDRIFNPALLSAELIVLASRSGSLSAVLEKDHGKAVDQVSLAADEVMAQSPIAAGKTVFFPTGRGVLAYSFNGCSAK